MSKNIFLIVLIAGFLSSTGIVNSYSFEIGGELGKLGESTKKTLKSVNENSKHQIKDMCEAYGESFDRLKNGEFAFPDSEKAHNKVIKTPGKSVSGECGEVGKVLKEVNKLDDNKLDDIVGGFSFR